jgi:hypothetical protein
MSPFFRATARLSNRLPNVFSFLSPSLKVAVAALSLLPLAAHADTGWNILRTLSGISNLQSTPISGTALKVVDENNQAIPNARVLIGSALDQPFAHNFLNTNANGEFEIPTAWTMTAPVTVDAPGFVRTTYDEMSPAVLSLQAAAGGAFVLKRGTTHSHITLKGPTTGFGEIPNGDDAHVAMVIPTFSWASVGTFDVGSLLSPETDDVPTPIKDFKIPSNLAIPAQDLHYGFFTVHVDKPEYRLIFADPGHVQLAGIRVHFPFQKVADMMRNKAPFTDVIKQFSFDSVGVKSFDVRQSADQSMPVNESPIQKITTYQGPTPSSTEILLAVYLTRTGENKIFPTDVQAIEANTPVRLGGVIGAAGYTGVIRMQKQTQPARQLLPVTSRANSFSLYELPGVPRPMGALDLVGSPVVTAESVQLAAPNAAGVAGLTLITQDTLQDVEASTSSMGKLERATPKWIVIHPGWANSVKLPKWPSDTLQGARWEVSFSAMGDREQHVTRNHTVPVLK